VLICIVLICSFPIWFCVTCVSKFSFALLMKFGVTILIFFFFNKITDFHSVIPSTLSPKIFVLVFDVLPVFPFFFLID
jgi:hypothetical protein